MGWFLFFIALVAIAWYGYYQYRHRAPSKEDVKNAPRTDAYGTAEFASPDYEDTGKSTNGVFLGQLYEPGLIYNRGGSFNPTFDLGDETGPYIFSKPETHVLICAPPGSGKSAGIVAPTLAEYCHSVFTIDVKGENTCMTVRRRKELNKKVHVLNPWGLHKELLEGYGVTSESINPLDLLDPNDERCVSNATFLTDLMMVPSEETSAKDPFWDNSAKIFIRGMLLYLVAAFPPEQRTLTHFADLINPDNEEALDTLLLDMKRFSTTAPAKNISQAIRAASSTILSAPENTRGGILTGARVHSDFLNDPVIRASMERSDFDFHELKEQATTVYVIIPSDQITNQARWLRLMVGMGLTAMERGEPTGNRCLFLLEEFAALGRLEKVRTGIALLRGYGVDMALVVQDLNQLKLLYGETWETLLSNCMFKYFSNISDNQTAKYVSEMLGDKTVTTSSQSFSDSITSSYSKLGAPLMRPDELITGSQNRGYILKTGSKPILVQYTPYWDDPKIAEHIDPNPMYNTQKQFSGKDPFFKGTITVR